MTQKKVRVNITVDAETLKKAKKHLSLFGGKLSTLFNAYLGEFVASRQREPSADMKSLQQRLLSLEHKMQKLEQKK